MLGSEPGPPREGAEPAGGTASAPALVHLAPAKINLALEILGRRPDGYHELISVVQTVGLYDRLEVAPADQWRFRCDRSDLAGETNLVVRAARLLRAVTGCRRGAQVTLSKRIPVAAGLGGGSSDAAAALVALNQFWELHLSAADLLAFAAKLGSDVPLFLAGPTVLLTGRGEQVQPLPSLPRRWIVLVRPSLGLATAAVYRALTAAAFSDGTRTRRLADAVGAGPNSGWERFLTNSLEPTAMTLCPAMAPLRRSLADLGARPVQMSGSGPTVFALCQTEREARQMARAMTGRRYPAWAVPFVTTTPRPKAAPTS